MIINMKCGCESCLEDKKHRHGNGRSGWRTGNIKDDSESPDGATPQVLVLFCDIRGTKKEVVVDCIAAHQELIFLELTGISR